MKKTAAAITAIILILASNAYSGEKKPLTFTVTLQGELEDRAATKAGFRTVPLDYAHIAFTNLDASDGENVGVYHAEFRNKDEAQRYFEWSLKTKFTQVLKHEDKLNHDGKIVGRRAELLLIAGDAKEWDVMWIENVHVIMISASSLEAAKELENQSSE